MKADGLENVHTEKVLVPHWVRGKEHGALVAPVSRPLHLLALGGSVGTPPGGITAPVVVVSSYEALERLGPEVKGKIVLFDNPMQAYDPGDPQRGQGPHSGYGEAVVFRSTGAIHAAKLGAVAVLVRSVTARSLRSPHTGATRYDAATPAIPAVAVSTEDAALIARLARGPAAQGASRAQPVKVHLELGARTLPDAESANVIGELRGTTRPEELVVLGAHLDSWDVGQGAHDDGAGCMTMVGAAALLQRLGLRPARTVRVVLFTNEENGLRGAEAYVKAHAAELPSTVAAIEADTGGFRPLGFEVEGPPDAVENVRQLTAALAPIGATMVASGYAGADIEPMKGAGVPLIGLLVEGSKYFDYHHSDADTFDKVDPEDLALDVGAVAALAHAIADLPARLVKDQT